MINPTGPDFRKLKITKNNRFGSRSPKKPWVFDRHRFIGIPDESNPWPSRENYQKWFFLWRFIKKAMDFCVFKARKMSNILPKKMVTGPLGLQCPSHLKLFLEPANQMALHHLGAAKSAAKKQTKKEAPLVSRSVCWSFIPSILVIIYSSWL